MKVGRTGLRMSSGEIRHFKSPGARERFERFAQGVKHGWRARNKKVRRRLKAMRRRMVK